MDKQKLKTLISNIRDLQYPIDKLNNIDSFEKQLANDLETEKEEALALLGYLLAGDYVRIDKSMGIVVNPSSKEIRDLIDAGQLK